MLVFLDLPNMDILTSGDLRYLIGTCLFLLAWIAMYIALPRSRPPMLWAGLILMTTAPVLDFLYTVDYWHPLSCLAFALDLPGGGTMVFAAEGFIFGFAISGLSAGLFDWRMRAKGHHAEWHISWSSYGRLWPAGLGAVLVILTIHFLLGLNTVHAHCLGCLILTVGFLWRIQREWIVPSLESGIGMVIIMAVIYYGVFFRIFPSFVVDAWKLDNLLGVNISGVPIEEFLWAGTSGLYIGAAVRYCSQREMDQP